jgi:hypothetical protein
MTLEIINRLFYVVVWCGGILAFFGHMRFYTMKGLKILEAIIGTGALSTLLIFPVGLVEWIFTGNIKLTTMVLGYGMLALIGCTVYLFLCYFVSNAPEKENKGTI